MTDADSIWAFDPTQFDPVDAVLLQPLACVLYAAERLGDVTDADCAVIGLGPIGLLFASVLAAPPRWPAWTGRSLRGRGQGRRRRLHWAGSEVWSAKPAYTEAYGIVVETVDHQTLALHHALAAVAEHGRVFYFGVPDEQTYPVE